MKKKINARAARRAKGNRQSRKQQRNEDFQDNKKSFSKNG